MIWIVPREKTTPTTRSKSASGPPPTQLWAGAGLTQSEYSEPVLGLTFLRFAEDRFAPRRVELERAASASSLS
jgi:type I restriction enzyme M protein